MNILEKNENPKIWRENIYNAVISLSDIEYQRLTWSGKHPKYISSFTETIGTLYDSYDFKRYILYYKSIKGCNALYYQFIELDKMIDEYKSHGYALEGNADGYLKILEDSHWIEITIQAKKIRDLWDSEERIFR